MPDAQIDTMIKATKETKELVNGLYTLKETEDDDQELIQDIGAEA
jgi:uncharacterized protein Yka (UPF0111/DUF47 family)